MKKFILKTLKYLGIFLGLVIVVFFIGVFWPLETPEPKAPETDLAITNVSLIDVETGEIRSGQTVVIEKGVIKSTLGGTYPIPSNARMFDGTGKYLIPGLFDMHAHSIKLSPELMHPLYVVNGVTAVRDMNGCLGEDDPWVACAEDKRAWTEAVIQGTEVSPRYDFITGLAINGGDEVPGGFDPRFGVANADAAAFRAEHDKDRGLDFLKTYSNLPREGYFALAEEAKKHDLTLAGHLPLWVNGFEAVEAGQTSFEHALIFLFECYADIETLRQTDNARDFFSEENRRLMLANQAAEKCEALHQAMAENNVALVPTHITRKLDAFANDEAFRTDARLKYIPTPLRMLWLDDADSMARRSSDPNLADFRQVFQFGIEQTGLAHSRGVPVMLGTDTPDSFAFPGYGIHDEMDHLAKAGLTNLEILQSATFIPSRFMGLEDEAGVIKPGARADLVLLNANPLEDLAAFKEVETVILAGAVYEKVDLAAMEDIVEENANSWTMWPKFIWQIIRSPIMRKQFGD